MTESSHESFVLLDLIKELTKFPDDAIVTEGTDERGILMTITVNPSDMGCVIGREGGNIKAIRTIMRSIGMKSNKMISIKVTDPRNEATDTGGY